MPVDFETHEPGNPRVDLSEGTNARRLLEFLLKTPTVGYTPAELAKETGIPRGSIGPTLKRLESVGLVRHKEPYWAAAEDDRIAAATAAFLGVEAVADTYSDDWYAENDGWAEELPDLSGEGS
ncbi:TrmB family transcriptional regulator [Halalkaliarchaeum desulfuricum]|uniref:TrmB family transcriptional regulator n=1 Tax=Halalkaliarchaeum desulfuricum TaxID=2055893 RepID=A0A343TJY1_9EURY|nr:winged helix-turn-helix domain-containing protein [Halalkaliarchaeum desulfuricum]AUX09403.1 TrmB family transcriptional regulator [Halalkaliarchaeum desulfuricum]